MNTITKHILLFFLLSNVAFGQGRNQIKLKPTPENFARVMRMTAPSEAQFDSIWVVTQFYHGKSPDSSLMLAQHAVAITKNSKTTRLHGEALYLNGKSLIESNKNPAAGLEMIMSAREILKNEKTHDSPVLVETFLGNYYSRSRQFEKGIEHLLNSLTLAKARKDTSGLVTPLMAVGGVYFQMRNVAKAQEYLSEALKMAEVSKQEEIMPTILSNQAKIFQSIGRRYKSIADTATVNAVLYRDTATFYFHKALDAADKGLSIAQKLNLPGLIVLLKVSTVGFKNDLGDFKAAESLGQEVLKMAEKIGAPPLLTDCHMNLAYALRNLGNYPSALQHAKAGLAIVEKDPRAGKIEVFEEELYKIYKAMGNTEMAMPLLEKAMENLRKSSEQGTKKAIADAETKYQTIEKENQILELAISNEKISKQRNFIMVGGLLISLLGFFGFRFNKVRKDRNDKKAFAEALIFAQEEERKRIARDLHDGVGQSLLLIKNQLERSAEFNLQNRKLIADTLEEVRTISRDLHPFQLDKFGLTATIESTIEKVRESTSIFITSEIENIDGLLPKDSEIHLFRTVQESLSNIVKHSGATAAKISVQNLSKNIKVVVQDNGRGFDLELAVVKTKSLGIKTMQERISAIGGQLKIGKGTNSGTQVEIFVPKTSVGVLAKTQFSLN